MNKEKIEIKNLIEFLRVIGSNSFKIKVEYVFDLGNKIQLEFTKDLDANKIYRIEIEKDSIEGQMPERGKEYIANAKFDENRGKFVLSLMPVEDEEDEENETFEIDKTTSIKENFERFVDCVVDELNERFAKEPKEISKLTSVDYLRPFVEDFVNKIQTDWIYANLDSKLVVKSFALYLAEQKGLNIERFKYLKEQYINIDIMLGTIILKQKIIDKYVKNYL